MPRGDSSRDVGLSVEAYINTGLVAFFSAYRNCPIIIGPCGLLYVPCIPGPSASRTMVTVCLYHMTSMWAITLPPGSTLRQVHGPNLSGPIFGKNLRRPVRDKKTPRPGPSDRDVPIPSLRLCFGWKWRCTYYWWVPDSTATYLYKERYLMVNSKKNRSYIWYDSWLRVEEVLQPSESGKETLFCYYYQIPWNLSWSHRDSG